MSKSIKVDKSIKDIFSPLSVNQFLQLLFLEDYDLEKIFWGGLKVSGVPLSGEFSNLTLEDETFKELNRIREIIKSKSGVQIPYTDVLFMLKSIWHSVFVFRIISVNVKGYKVTSTDFLERISGLATEINKITPDIIFLQEFKIGEDKIFARELMASLDVEYDLYVPMHFNVSKHYGLCICAVLVRKGIKSIHRKELPADDGKKSYSLRYDLIEVDSRVFLNVWMPQIFNPDADRLRETAEFWADINSVVDMYCNMDTEFYLLGDLNSYIGNNSTGPFAEELIRLRSKLIETKINADINRITGEENVLDYFFANRYAVQNSMITTRILEPSIREKELSDHDALLTEIVLPMIPKKNK